MSSLFTDAKCVQCGGEIDLLHLVCVQCNSRNIPIDWARAVPVFSGLPAEAPYHDWRDRRLDAAIIAKLQILAAAAGVEIALELSAGQNTSYLKILAHLPTRDVWEEVGSICGFASHGPNGFEYTLHYRDPWGRYIRPSSVYFHWAADLAGGSGARWYTVKVTGYQRLSEGYKCRGEVGLYDSEILKRTLMPFLLITHGEEESDKRYREKAAAERDYARIYNAQPLLKRLFMRPPDNLYL